MGLVPHLARRVPFDLSPYVLLHSAIFNLLLHLRNCTASILPNCIQWIDSGIETANYRTFSLSVGARWPIRRTFTDTNDLLLCYTWIPSTTSLQKDSSFLWHIRTSVSCVCMNCTYVYVCVCTYIILNCQCLCALVCSSKCCDKGHSWGSVDQKAEPKAN